MLIPELFVRLIDANSNYDDLEKISFINHQLLINYEPVESHFDGDNFYWIRKNSKGQDEHGAIRLFSHGLMGDGVIESDGFKHAFKASATIGYSIIIDNDTSWNEFDMGFQEDQKGYMHAYGSFNIPGNPEDTKKFNDAATVVFSIVQNDRKEDVLHAHFDVAPLYCSLAGSKWIGGDFNFNLNYSNFQGDIYEYDEMAPDYHGAKHTVKGFCKDFNLIEQLKKNILSSTSSKGNNKFVTSKGSNIQNTLLKAVSLRSDIENSIEDLYTLPAPDLSNVHELSFNKLKSLMIYAIDDKWRKWFGEKKPTVGPNGTLTEDDVKLLDKKDIKSFLTDKFAVGYLTQAFSKSSDPKIQEEFKKLNKYEDKLAYFWKGTGEKCFGKYPGYNLATASLLDNAYAVSTPGLERYLLDNPVEWAKKLYEYCTTPVTLNGLALQNTLDGRKRLTHLTTMLHALDPVARIVTSDSKNISYATSLYQRVIDVRLNFVISRFSSDNKEDFVSFLTEYFKQYFDSLLSGGTWQDAVCNEAKKDLDALMEEFKVKDTAALMLQIGNIISDSVEVLIKFKDLPMPARINKWAADNPRISKFLGSTMTMAVYSFGIFSSIKSFMDWKELEPQEKVQAVVDMVDVSASIFNDIVKFNAAKKLATAEASITEIMEASGEIQSAVDLERATEIANKIGVRVDVELADLSSPALARGGAVAGEALTEAGELAETASKWTSFAKVSAAFAEGMTIIALGAACVCTGFQIASDFSSGQPVAIKVLDILEMVSNGVAFLVELGSGAAALLGAEVCSAIPVIGVVAVVVGIVIAVVSMFIHRNPPPTEEEKFVTDHAVVFINALDMPSNQWISDQEKIAKHLDPNNSARTLTYAI